MCAFSFPLTWGDSLSFFVYIVMMNSKERNQKGNKTGTAVNEKKKTGKRCKRTNIAACKTSCTWAIYRTILWRRRVISKLFCYQCSLVFSFSSSCSKLNAFELHSHHTKVSLSRLLCARPQIKHCHWTIYPVLSAIFATMYPFSLKFALVSFKLNFSRALCCFFLSKRFLFSSNKKKMWPRRDLKNRIGAFEECIGCVICIGFTAHKICRQKN